MSYAPPRRAAIAFGLAFVCACAPKTQEMQPPRGGGPAAPVAADTDGKKDDWDVNAPVGPQQKVAIDVTEGTWMSLDVAPDGKSIVFDLLGDLYRLPIEGGEAQPLTSGVAWDMQPRYSPDGKWIAFTSDRGGGDNVWIMGADGSDPRAVTKETFRLVNSPVWSPDGDFLAVRKHFTSRRSLGAGEIWLYHRFGGAGLQLTERPNDQKDAGEPAFSPDGRFIYFSQDTTPGKTFEYNKDPHGEIYVIQRLDRTDGRIEPFINGPGGAVRPTPSPDGKSIAYVRRLGLKTALMLQDVKSGEERVLWDGLERDLQETWAIHGVYPAMAFTPDSQAIIVWAGGKIHRVLTQAAGQAEVIPFHVKAERTVFTAVRTPIEIHPERFDTKMLRWVTVAPDGKSVLYQALGHLYVRPLPDGRPRRLTTDDEFEFYPAFSRDGRSIVYVTWDDDNLGEVRVVSAKGGRSRTVTSQPGHYIEPVFSPDGETIVYRRVDGGGLRSRAWSRERGIYAVSVRGGEPLLVRRGGFGFHFGNDSRRVYFTEVEVKDDQPKFQLQSIEVDGSDPYTHLESKSAVEYAVSPDGRFVAFREEHNAFIAPFPPTGRKWEVGPKTEAIPVAKVSKDAGEFLHWSGDGKRLHWSLGAQLYSRELHESFAFLEGAPAELPEPPASGIDVGFSIDSDIPTGKLALVGGRIVTMKGDEVIQDGVVVIDRNRIVAVGAKDKVAVPGDAMVLDVGGKTLVPGFVDVHAHGPQGQDGLTPRQNWLHLAELAFGVTTVHDPSNDTGEVFAAAELARAGMIVAPRIFSTGTILYGAETPFMAKIDGLEDARAHLRRMKAVGAFSVKSYNQPRRNQRQQVLAAARELEMMVVPEGGSLFQHNMTMVVDGHTGIEHAVPLANLYQDVVQLWSATQVGYTPTIVVGYGGIWGENYWYAKTDVFDNPRLRTFVPPWEFEPRSRRRMLASDDDWNHIRIARHAKHLTDAGVRVNLGAHGQREGLAAHWELWSFVQGGMTPLQALRAATLNGAWYIGLDRDIGSIEPGKLADIAVIDGNPLEDIRVSENVAYTVINGRIFDARTMDEVGNHPRKRKPLFWQREPIPIEDVGGRRRARGRN